MKKVVLLTGVLAAGLAAAPVAANAASPILPDTQEVNGEETAEGYHGKVLGLINTIDANIAEVQKKIVNGTITFQDPVAKQQALDDISKIANTLADVRHDNETNYSSMTEADFIAWAQKYVEKPYENLGIDLPQSQDGTLEKRYAELDKDWAAFHKWQDDGAAVAALYLALNGTADFKKVNDCPDVVAARNAYAEASKAFNNAIKSYVYKETSPGVFDLSSPIVILNPDDRFTHPTTECITANAATIQGLYDTLDKAEKAVEKLVKDYMKAQEDLTTGTDGYKTLFNNFENNIKKNPADFKPETETHTEIDGAVKDSDKATIALNAAAQKVKDAQVAASFYIDTFNAADNQADADKWINPGSLQYKGENSVAPKFADLQGYKNGAANASLKALKKAIKDYQDLLKDVQENLDTYNSLISTIESQPDNNHNHFVYPAGHEFEGQPLYKSEAFDDEVPAAHKAAIEAAKKAYEEFTLQTLDETTPDPLATDANNKVEAYKKIVKDANLNEAAHNREHEVLDPIAKAYEAALADFLSLINDRTEKNTIDATAGLTDGDVITELYPTYTENDFDINSGTVLRIHSVRNVGGVPTQSAAYTYKGTQKSALDILEAYKNAKLMYDTAKKDTEDYYNAGKSVEKEILLKAYYNTTLKPAVEEFEGQIKAARDNEAAFLEGAKAIANADDASTTLSQEYYDHPEVYADWKTQIKTILDKYDVVRDELVKAYDVEAKAREYVTNTLQGKLDGIKAELDELIKKINENKRAYDQNNAAVADALHNLAAVKADYDTKKFETKKTETKDKDVFESGKTGEPTSLKADFDAAWTAMYPEVKAGVEAKIGTTTSDFTLPATATDFDHDVAFILSKIKSENGVDFNALHYAAATDYTPNLDAVKYINDEVIPALADKFAELVKANEDAYAEQLKTYNDVAEQISYYECNDVEGVNAAAVAITDPAGLHCDVEENAVLIAKNDADAALKDYQNKLDNGYILGESAKTDLSAEKDAYENKLGTYKEEVEKAQKNDGQFVADYKALETLRKPADLNPKDWTVKPLDADLDANGYSNHFNTEVANAAGAAQTAYDKYLSAIKTSWQAEKSVADKVANAALLKDYTDALKAYDTAVENAKKNDKEYKKEIESLGAFVDLHPVLHPTTHPEATAELTNLRQALTNLEPKCNAAAYAAVQNDIVADWDNTEKLLDATEVAKNEKAIAEYQDAADKYNKIVDALNLYCDDLHKIADLQANLDNATIDVNGTPVKITDLDVMTKKLHIDSDVKDFDKNKKDIEQKIKDVQTLIDNLQKACDKEAKEVRELVLLDTDKSNDRPYSLVITEKENEINGAIGDLKNLAENEQAAYDANEKAFEPLHDTMKATLVDVTNTSLLAEPAKEAFEKMVALAGYEKLIEKEIENLENEYLAENAVNYDPTDFNKIKDAVDYARKVAETVGDKMGDVDGNGTVDEFDFMYLLEELILKNVQIADGEFNNPGDLDLNSKYQANDLVLLSNYIWYKNFDGVQKAQAHRGAFEAELNADVIGNTVAIAIDNNYEFNALQFDVTVPAGAKLTDLVATTRAQGLIVASNKYAEDTYRVVIVGMGAGNMISGNEGNVISFNVFGAEGEVEIFNVSAANGISHDLNGAAVVIGTTTGIDEVATEGNTEIFGLDGIRQNVMKAGVNIVRSANGAVKKIFNK